MSNEQKERGLLSNFAKRIEQLAFEMPAPNPYTPQFVMLAQSLDAYARTHESKAVGLDVEAIIKAARCVLLVAYYQRLSAHGFSLPHHGHEVQMKVAPQAA